MKKWIIFLLGLSPSAAFAAGAGGINLTPDPKALLRSTNTWTGSQTFKSSTTFDGDVTINGNCTGCGSGGGGGGGAAIYNTANTVSFSTLAFPGASIVNSNGMSSVTFATPRTYDIIIGTTGAVGVDYANSIFHLALNKALSDRGASLTSTNTVPLNIFVRSGTYDATETSIPYKVSLFAARNSSGTNFVLNHDSKTLITNYGYMEGFMLDAGSRVFTSRLVEMKNNSEFAYNTIVGAQAMANYTNGGAILSVEHSSNTKIHHNWFKEYHGCAGRTFQGQCGAIKVIDSSDSWTYENHFSSPSYQASLYETIWSNVRSINTSVEDNLFEGVHAIAVSVGTGRNTVVDGNKFILGANNLDKNDYGIVVLDGSDEPVPTGSSTFTAISNNYFIFRSSAGGQGGTVIYSRGLDTPPRTGVSISNNVVSAPVRINWSFFRQANFVDYNTTLSDNKVYNLESFVGRGDGHGIKYHSLGNIFNGIPVIDTSPINAYGFGISNSTGLMIGQVQVSQFMSTTSANVHLLNQQTVVVSDEGGVPGSHVTVIDFRGEGVASSQSGSTVTVTINGGGGGGGGSGAIYNGAQAVAVTTWTLVGANYAFDSTFASVTIHNASFTWTAGQSFSTVAIREYMTVPSMTVTGQGIVKSSWNVQGVITSTAGFIVHQSTTHQLTLAAGSAGSPSLSWIISNGRNDGLYGTTGGFIFTKDGADRMTFTDNLTLAANASFLANPNTNGIVQYSFAGDATTGLYQRNTDLNLMFYLNNVEKMRFGRGAQTISLGGVIPSPDVGVLIATMSTKADASILALSTGSNSRLVEFRGASTTINNELFIGEMSLPVFTSTMTDILKSTTSELADNTNTINAATNMVSWNSLKDVPAGFADGTDNTGGGGGGGASIEVLNGTTQISSNSVATFNFSSGPFLLKPPLAAATTAYIDLSSATKTRVFGVTIDGAGGVIATSTYGFVSMGYAGTISSYTILGDQAGSIRVNIKKASFENFPPVTSVCSAACPGFSGTAQKNRDHVLTGWDRSFNEGDVYSFNVDTAPATVTRINLQIYALTK